MNKKIRVLPTIDFGYKQQARKILKKALKEVQQDPSVNGATVVLYRNDRTFISHHTASLDKIAVGSALMKIGMRRMGMKTD